MVRKFKFVFITSTRGKWKTNKIGRIMKFNTLKEAVAARSFELAKGNKVSKIAKTTKV